MSKEKTDSEYLYSINQTVTSVSEDGGNPTITYGITCTKNGEIVESVEDICIKKETLSPFVTFFNEIQLNPKNLKDEILNNMDNVIDYDRTKRGK